MPYEDITAQSALYTTPLGVTSLGSTSGGLETDVLATGGYKDNPNYKLIITHHGKKKRVTAYLPEQFHFRVANDWEPFLSSLTTGSLLGAVGDVVRTGFNIAGKSVNIKALSALVWKRSEPIDFNFTLQFDTRTSAAKDVKEPTQTLIEFAAPSRTGGIFLNAPGPTIADSTNRISLRVGRFFFIDSVVIKTLDITYYTASDKDGDFIAADAEIVFESWYTPDADDILTYFGVMAKQIPLLGDNQIYSPGQDIAKIGNNIISAAAGLVNTFGNTPGVDLSNSVTGL